MLSWNETKRRKIMSSTMGLTAELILWNLMAHSANQINVIFFDPFESELVGEVQDGLW
jgi:hypothetical protein